MLIYYVLRVFFLINELFLEASPELTAYVRAGARKTLWYKKDEVGAVIVTCGGICPGLNNIIREIVITLYILIFSFHFIDIDYMV